LHGNRSQRSGPFVDAKISPKGTYLAGISTEGGKRWLSIVDLANRKLVSTFRPNPESVGEFYWANDSRVLGAALERERWHARIAGQPRRDLRCECDRWPGEMIFGFARKGSAPVRWA
jgi:hypothetical protein